MYLSYRKMVELCLQIFQLQPTNGLNSSLKRLTVDNTFSTYCSSELKVGELATSNTVCGSGPEYTSMFATTVGLQQLEFFRKSWPVFVSFVFLRPLVGSMNLMKSKNLGSLNLILLHFVCCCFATAPITL